MSFVFNKSRRKNLTSKSCRDQYQWHPCSRPPSLWKEEGEKMKEMAAASEVRGRTRTRTRKKWETEKNRSILCLVSDQPALFAQLAGHGQRPTFSSARAMSLARLRRCAPPRQRWRQLAAMSTATSIPKGAPLQTPEDWSEMQYDRGVQKIFSPCSCPHCLQSPR